MEWPRDPNKAASFEDVVNPLTESARHLLRVEWDGEDVPYDGFPLSLSSRAGSFNPDERLKAEQLRYDDDEQGRDPLEVMISLAVQVGIEQGRRIDREREGARTSYEISEAVEASAAEMGLTPAQAATLDFLVRKRLEKSEDLLTRIHYERTDSP